MRDYYAMARALVVLNRAEDAGEQPLHTAEVLRRVKSMTVDDEAHALQVAERLRQREEFVL